MQNNLSQLRNTLMAIVQITEEEWTAFEKIWEPYTAKRKTTLTSIGEREKYLYFVVDGVQRVFYEDAEGREATLVFTYPYSFGGSLDSMLNGNISAYQYETLTNSGFLRAPYHKLKALELQYPGIKQFVEKGLLTAFSGILQRLVELQCFSSEEKFRSMLKRSPHILHLVPHKYLANYLGIAPTNFSKLINQKLI